MEPRAPFVVAALFAGTFAATLLGACASPAPAATDVEPRFLGRVVDREGHGVADILVRPWGGIATRSACATTRTDADGRFSVPAWTCGARVGHSDRWFAYIGITFDETTFASDDGESWWDVEVPVDGVVVEERVWTFSPGGGIEGRVVDATTGAPLELSLRMYTGTAGAAHSFRWFESDADGRFREIGLAPGDYTIDVNSVNGRYPELARCRIDAERTTQVELAFTPVE